ncbi:MAG: nucleotide exchange factor GrpE [Sphaerochaetaceae bacterium]
MSKKEKKEEKVEEKTVEEAVEQTGETVEQIQDQPEETTPSPQEIRIAELEADVEELKRALNEEKETFLRKTADMDNYRKRLIREKESAVQYANERLISDLIPIIDDFDRALEASGTQDTAGHADGIRMIRQQLLDVLDRNWGLKPMEDIVGKEFSPHEHEALMMETGDQYESEIVLAELQKGYYLHSKVLRHAKVKVGKPS